MFAQPKDLEALLGRGPEFEELLYDLIVSEASRHGVPPHQVDWDPDTNAPDGGRDVIVKQAHQDPNPRFLPQRPSIWSAKSGEIGKDPDKLRAEVAARNHPKLQQHLRDGNPYVWAALIAASKDERDRMEERARKIERDLSFARNLIEFRWQDALCTLLNDHPGLIAKHFPAIAQRSADLLSLAEWEREEPRGGFTVEWVEFSARSQVRDRVRDHLRARSGPNVLHLAGLSGVGKTRTVLEACRANRDLGEVLYVPRYERFSDTFLRYLTRNEHVLALVVIDEVPLGELAGFCSRVQDFASRLRFVTIGPGYRGLLGRQSANLTLLVLPEPEMRTGVLEVVRRVGAGLSEPVLESIAQFSAHDLRLALLLVEASRSIGEYQELPIQDGADLWNRILRLFGPTLRDRRCDPEVFRTCYPYLTVGIDLGFRGELRGELQYVADHFDVPAGNLDAVIPAAEACGLGTRSPSFFEASPRALAGHLFRRLWPSLEPRVHDFLAQLPDRLLRRFLERCQECSGEEREQMEEALQRFFFNALGERDLAHLADRERSRLFAAWAELDPPHGLAWLRDAVAWATDEQLAALDGAPDGGGGWRGRRQIVWLCEALAGFGDYFWTCEAILFRLAQVETEPAIGNNSTRIWQQLFWPALAFTEIPFPERQALLLRRLQGADARTLPLILSAAVGAMQTLGGRMAPPTVVGGRLVPEPWNPPTHEELRQLRTELGRRTFETVSLLAPALRREAQELIVAHLATFLNLRLLPELRVLLNEPAADDPFRQRLRIALNQAIAVRQQVLEHKPAPGPDPLLAGLREWHAQLAPPDLGSRIKELTAEEYWSVMSRLRRQEVSTHG